MPPHAGADQRRPGRSVERSGRDGPALREQRSSERIGPSGALRDEDIAGGQGEDEAATSVESGAEHEPGRGGRRRYWPLSPRRRSRTDHPCGAFEARRRARRSRYPGVRASSSGGSSADGLDAGDQRVLEGLLGEVASAPPRDSRNSTKLPRPHPCRRRSRSPSPAVMSSSEPMSSGAKTWFTARQVRVLGQAADSCSSGSPGPSAISPRPDGLDDRVVVRRRRRRVVGRHARPATAVRPSSPSALAHHGDEVLERARCSAQGRPGPA